MDTLLRSQMAIPKLKELNHLEELINHLFTSHRFLNFPAKHFLQAVASKFQNCKKQNFTKLPQ